MNNEIIENMELCSLAVSGLKTNDIVSHVKAKKSLLKLKEKISIYQDESVEHLIDAILRYNDGMFFLDEEEAVNALKNIARVYKELCIALKEKIKQDKEGAECV